MANSTMVFPFGSELAIWLGGLGFTDLPKGAPITSFSPQLRDGAWPPFSKIDVWPDFVSVRHGGYAAYAVTVLGSQVCGPLVALDGSGAGLAVVTADTTYEEFSRAFGFDGDEERDSAWTPAHA